MKPCDICDKETAAADLIDEICSACWIESASKGGIHADLTFRLSGLGMVNESISLGEFMEACPGMLTAPQISRLVWMFPSGDSITFPLLGNGKVGGGGVAGFTWTFLHAGQRQEA